ncbi:MAG: M24 family metallopeptidase [Fimbriimonadaceae bacterium]
MPSRIESLANNLLRENVAAYFAATPVSMGYLTGFFEDGGERFLTLGINPRGEHALICPKLSEEQAKREGVAHTRPWTDSENPLILFEQLAHQWELQEARIAVDNKMQAAMLLKMQQVLPKAEFIEGEPILAELRRRKEQAELESLRKAARIADETFNDVFPQITAGMTEAELADRLLQGMKQRGGEPTFSIVATGKNGAEPHHLTDDTPLQAGDVVVIDFGCSVDGYQSDITRTVAVENVSEEAAEAYRQVHKAHMAGRQRIAAGVSAESVDQATRKVLNEAGLGEYFVHRTGHGIGLEGHEPPFIVQGNGQQLVAGDCFSIEPGVYLPGKFGIRIENIVMATTNGHESLNEEPSVEIMVTSR